MKRIAAAVALAVAAGTTFILSPTTADATAPVQTGWWNVSGAPAPTAPSDGLHISVAPGGPTGTGQVLAFGAVLYDVPAGATGTLELKVSGEGVPNPNPDYPDQATQPNINLAGCPTTQPWKAGGNQAGPGPTYDCSHEINGNLSADGQTVTFFFDTNGQTGDGTLSLAIVPVMNDTVPVVRTEVPGVDMTEPFSVDVAKPAADSLVVTGSTPAAPSAGGRGGAATPPTTSKPSGATGGSTTNGGSAGGSTAGPVDISVPGSTTTAPTDAGAAPVVANQTPAAAPAAAVRPASTSSARRDTALALLILLAVAVLLTNQRSARLPREALAQAAPNLDAATLALLSGYGNRGLGRFAKPRTDNPRPLV